MFIQRVYAVWFPQNVLIPSLRLRWFSGGTTLRFHSLNDRVSEFRCAGLAADIPCKFATVAINLIDGIAYLQSGVMLAEMAQHQQGGSQHCGGIGDISSGDVGCGTMDSFKNGALMAEIRSGDEAQSAHQPRAQVGMISP